MGDSQLLRFASLRGLLLPPGPPCFLHSWTAPSDRATSHGGFAASPLRFAQGAATPPWTPLLLTLVDRAFGPGHEPWGIRSFSASLRSGGCYSPLDPPASYTRGPRLRTAPRAMGISSFSASLCSGGRYFPLEPPASFTW